MANIKEILGDAYKEDMTLEEVDKALESKKLVDLSTGDYVSKAKYDNLETKHKNLQAEFDQVKEQTKDYETLKTENESFKSEKANAELKQNLVKYGIKDTAFKYVKGDIDAKELELGDDEKVNEANVKKYLEAHPEFATTQTPPAKQVNRQVGTGVVIDPNNQPNAKSVNAKLHEAFADGK